MLKIGVDQRVNIYCISGYNYTSFKSINYISKAQFLN